MFAGTYSGESCVVNELGAALSLVGVRLDYVVGDDFTVCAGTPENFV